MRGALPTVFAIAVGVIVRSVQANDSLTTPLVFGGAVFALLQVLPPIHQAIGANLGDRTAAWLYDRLTEACARPAGMGHLEDPLDSGTKCVRGSRVSSSTGPAPVRDGYDRSARQRSPSHGNPRSAGAAVGEFGFLRGFWMDGSRRLAWLEDYVASLNANTDLLVPARLSEGIRFDNVSFAYPGTERLVLENVSLNLPAGAVVAIVGENGAGKTTLVKLLSRFYEPNRGAIPVDGRTTHANRGPYSQLYAIQAAAYT